MEFWNMSVPALIFSAPVAAAAYVALGGRLRYENEARAGIFVFGLLMLVAVAGIFHFENSVRLEFLWPFSAEPSGYFAFSLHLRWTRFVWILFASSSLVALLALEGKSALQGQGRGTRFFFLCAASVFSSLAFLSENVVLAVLFLEVSFFFLHSFIVTGGAREAGLERLSYFKRNSFIVLALLALLLVTVAGVMSAGSVMLLGAVLYGLSFIFSRWNFSNWNHLPISLLQAAGVFFILGRVIGESTPPDLLVPLAAVAGALTAVFALLSLLSVSAIGSTFWLLFSTMGFLFFQRLGSGRPEELFWGTYEAIALFSVFALGTLFRCGRKAGKAWERAVSYLLCAVILGVVSGAIPGVDVTGYRMAADSSVRLVVWCVLAFLLALVAGKAMMVCFTREEEAFGNDPPFAYGLAIGVALLLAQVGAVFRVSDVYGEGPFRMGAAFLLSNPFVVATGSSVLVGLLAGLLVGSNSRFSAGKGKKERRMEDFFPSVDPSLIRWNEKGSSAPADLLDKAGARAVQLAGTISGSVQSADRALFSRAFYEGVRHYGELLSQFLRYFHTGNLRLYMFLGAVITLFASALFLLEAK